MTDDDKTLLRCGLTLNGPHLCNKLFGYDVGSPVETLVEASKLLLNEALNIYDKNRLPSTFFEPYPVLESTRIKYYMHRLMRKITGYTLLTTSANNQTKVDQIIDNLRRKHIILDLTEYFKTTLIPDYYKRRIG